MQPIVTQRSVALLSPKNVILLHGMKESGTTALPFSLAACGTSGR